MTPEGKVKAKIRRTLKEIGAYAYAPVQNGMGVVGIPDIIACIPTKITHDMVGKNIGVFAGIECKAPGKITNTTPNQKRNLADIMKADGVAIVADSDEVLSQALEALHKGDVMYSVPLPRGQE